MQKTILSASRRLYLLSLVAGLSLPGANAFAGYQKPVTEETEALWQSTFSFLSIYAQAEMTQSDLTGFSSELAEDHGIHGMSLDGKWLTEERKVPVSATGVSMLWSDLEETCDVTALSLEQVNQGEGRINECQLNHMRKHWDHINNILRNYYAPEPREVPGRT